MTYTLQHTSDVLAGVPDSWTTSTFAATAWDPGLKRKEHALVARRRVLKAGKAWTCANPAGRTACAWLTVNAWDTEFFGVRMAVLGLEGNVDGPALDLLLPLVIAHASRESIVHIRTSQRAGAPSTLHALQRHGFHVRWASVQIACDTRTLCAGAPPCPPGLRFTEATDSHLPELLAAARCMAPFNWPEFDPALPGAARRGYLAQRIENCLTTPFANSAIVALWRDRPVGLHASATCTHDDEVNVGRRFAYVRETFVTPDTPPRLGAHLIRASLHALRDQVQLVTGRVRLDGRAMLDAALASGYEIVGDELLLTRATP
jgi:hypothetical protein